MPVFLHCLTLSGWFDCIGVLYSSVCVGSNPAKIHLWSARYQHYFLLCKTVHHLSSFYFSKPSAKMADVGKLLWAQMSYIVFVWVQVYLWLPENVVAYEFRWHWIFVCIVKHHFLSFHLFSYAYINVHKSTIVHSYHLQLRAWATLASWPSSYRYWLCSVPLTALLLHYPCKIAYMLRLHDGYKDSLQISVIAVLSYTGDLFFPLLSVYASCSSSIGYNIHFAFVN